MSYVAGQMLYRKAGFEVVNPGMMAAGPLRQILMRKVIPVRRGNPNELDDGSSDEISIVASAGPLDLLPQSGIYTWKTKAENRESNGG